MTLPADYFDALYAAAADPWQFADRFYEARKRQLVLGCLPDPHYPRAFEPGCSTGELTAALAPRCGALHAVDTAAGAVRAARRRTRRWPHVTVAQAALPADWPAATYDLVVLSELAYYFGPADRADLLGRAVRAIAPGGTLLAVHWRHPVPDYPATGDQVQDELATAAREAGLHRLGGYCDADLRLDVFSRDARSVAGRTGLPGAGP